MKSLIPVVNHLQDILISINSTERIELPQIAVVGNQSSGKSSQLESIMGRELLPRGTGIVTRRPVVIQLFNIPEDQKEYIELSHLPGEKFEDHGDVAKELENEMSRVAGYNKGISNIPIVMKVFANDVVNLSIIDLPGIVKVPIGDQPADIEEKTRDIIKSYIEEENTIILCVQPANVDQANSDALKLAQEVDPNGERTFGVLTKMDLIDQTNTGVEIIEGSVYPLALGYAGVVLRSSVDIGRGKTLKDHQQTEEQYFNTHTGYKDIIHRLGIKNLTHYVNQLQSCKIKEQIPDIKDNLNTLIDRKEGDLKKYGDFIDMDKEKSNKGALQQNIINQFSSHFNDIINVRNSISYTGELFGGARINYIFSDILIRKIQCMDPSEIMSDDDIRVAIRNCNGLNPSLTISEAAFQLLTREQISRQEQPSLDCSTLVHQELRKIVYDLCIPELTRFENLQREIKKVLDELFLNCKQLTDTMIKNLIEVEIGHINTRHPDFVGGARENVSNNKISEDENNREYNETSNKNHTSQRKKMNRQDSQDEKGIDNKMKNSKNETEFKMKPNKRSQHYAYTIDEQLGSNSMKKYESVMTNTLGKVPDKIFITSEMSRRESNEIKLIKKMLISYFDVVKKTICDLIPKTIITMLVRKSVSICEKELVKNLYLESKIEYLLTENSVATKKRDDLRAGLGEQKNIRSALGDFEGKLYV